MVSKKFSCSALRKILIELMDSFNVAIGALSISINKEIADVRHPRMHSLYLRKRRIAARSFRDCILRVESCSLSGMRNDATGAAGRQCKTSKLQNCLMTGYPGYLSGEVIMRLRGANKTRNISYYCLLCFVFYAFLGGAANDVSCHLNF